MMLLRIKDFKVVFQKSNLLQSIDMEECSRIILKKLSTEEYYWLSIVASKLGKYIVIGRKSLREILLNDQIEYSISYISELSIRQEIDKNVQKVINTRKFSIVSTLHNNLHSKLAVPTIIELMSATKEKPLD